MFLSIFPGSARPDAAADYRNFCAVCHGENGDGRTHAMAGLSPPPRSFRAPGLAAELSRDEMIAAVTRGKPGTAMVAWQTRLDRSRVGALVDYIRANFMSSSPNAGQLARNHPAWELYARACENCHGADGSGAAWTLDELGQPPPDFLAEQSADLNRERIRFSIANGRPGTAMPAYASRFSDAEIDALGDFVWTALMGRGAGRAAGAALAGNADPGAPMPNGLNGDPAAGAAIFAANCADCHGEDGGGDGPRAQRLDPPPRPFGAVAQDRPASRPVLFAVVSVGIPGRAMPAMGAVLSAQEVADVAEYVFQAFFNSAETP